MKPIYSDILKELRKDKKLTQQDMGDMMGISQATYCDYENGVRRMPLSMLSFWRIRWEHQPTTSLVGQRSPGPTPNGLDGLKNRKKRHTVNSVCRFSCLYAVYLLLLRQMCIFSASWMSCSRN